MKRFDIEYYLPWDPLQQIFRGQFDAPSELVAREKVRSGWYEVKWTPIEVIHQKTFLERVQEYYDSNISSATYNEEVEVSFLRSFAIGLSDGLTPAQALRRSKFNFGKSNTKVRGIIDELIAIEEKGGVADLYELFAKKEEFFSPNFLTLMKESRNVESTLVKLISNPVDPLRKWREVEWYVEITESIIKLKSEMIKAITFPTLYFLGLMIAVFTVLIGIIPGFKKAFSKVRDISHDDYTFIGNTTVAVSNFLVSYGIYVLLALIAWVAAVVFFYKSSDEFRRGTHEFLLKSPMIGDIITTFYTKKLTSLWAMFNESGMYMDVAVRSLVSMTPFMPMKEELDFIAKRIKSDQFSDIFRKYPEEERYFTETTYLSLEMEWADGRYGRAFASIIKNADDLWETDLKKYPKKIGAIILYGGLAVVGFFVTGLMIIFVKTLFNSI